MAIPKLFNCNQFNGKFGFKHCLNEGYALQKPRKRIYKYSINDKIRSNEDYLDHVKTAQE